MNTRRTIFATGALLSLGILAWFRPCFTASISSEEGIASLERITLGGMEQWILIRGKNSRDPILLWLHGGPGAAQMPIAHHLNGSLEDHFIVVHWDQRGAGKSNPSHFDETTMTFQQYLTDAYELTLYLKSRFSEEKIYLVGHSWGTLMGIQLAQAYPEDYHAFIGVSQVINPDQSEHIGFRWLWQIAKAENNGRLEESLLRLGEPPYHEHKKFVEYAMLIDENGGGFDIRMSKLAWIALQAPEYNLGDLAAWLSGSNRGSGPMWNDPEYQDFNALTQIPKLDIPVYFFSGRQDFNTPLQLVNSYFEDLDAPQGKELIIFDESSHTPFLGETEKFNTELIRIKRQTYPQ